MRSFGTRSGDDVRGRENGRGRTAWGTEHGGRWRRLYVYCRYGMCESHSVMRHMQTERSNFESDGIM